MKYVQAGFPSSFRIHGVYTVLTVRFDSSTEMANVHTSFTQVEVQIMFEKTNQVLNDATFFVTKKTTFRNVFVN